MVDTLRIIVLTFIVALSVVRLTSMPRGRATELEAWAFIFIAIGGFWRLCVITAQLPLIDYAADEALSGLITGIGVLFLCINAFYGDLRRSSLTLPDRRRCAVEEEPLHGEVAK